MSSANLLSYLGWAFLPDLATGWIQTTLYAVFIRAGNPKPQPGTPRFVLHRRRVYVAVILTYLVYSLYEAHWEIRRASDHYTLLGVSPSVDDRALQSRFRKLTLLYHPDKLNPSAAQRPAVEAYYAALLTARDTLLDPVRRAAYDRFGADAALWKCATLGDCVAVGLRALAPYYVAWAGALLASSVLGWLSWGTYWRWLALAAVGALEVRLLTRGDAALLPGAGAAAMLPDGLAALLPRAYLPFQTLQFTHKAVVSVFIALSRVGPVLEAMQDPAAAAAGGGTAEQQLARMAQRLEQQVGAASMETTRQLAMEAVPFGAFEAAETQQEDPRRVGLQGLKDGVRDWLVTNNVRNDREVQEAVKRVVQRNRSQ